MHRPTFVLAAIAGLSAFRLTCPGVAAEPAYRSHPPMRPLPQASNRPMAAGPSRFVDGKRGSDSAAGSQSEPWKTLARAGGQLRPGQTLYLRGGTYYESVQLSLAGTREQPITIRSYPGELVILDGGFPEFFETPRDAWMPHAEGADGEFVSTRQYPQLQGSGAVGVLGNFGDSMVPLHGSRNHIDLINTNQFWNLDDKMSAEQGIYCGPGIWFNEQTQRIHCRLAHTTLPVLGADNYRGETDPRELPLVIAGGPRPPLTLAGCQFVRIQDLAVRGSRPATISINDCDAIELDGVTAYGGSAAVGVRGTTGLRLVHCGLRGIAAPWTFRGSLKYRSIEARILSASGWSPSPVGNCDFEIAYCEITDCVDGVFIGNVQRVRLHHSLVDNVSDDGVFLTATTAPDGATAGGDVHIHQNVLSRCLTTFAFGVGHGRQRAIATGKQTGAGVFVYRNVFDFRRPVAYHMPTGPADPLDPSIGRVASDHGGPAWEPMDIYHNTVIGCQAPDNYYAAGLAGHLGGGTRRRIYNNIFLHPEGSPGLRLPEVPEPPVVAKAPKKDDLDLDDLLTVPKKSFSAELLGDELKELEKQLAKKPPPAPPLDFAADGNLHWSPAAGSQADRLLDVLRSSDGFARSKQRFPPGWAGADRVADPRFARFDADWKTAVDLSLRPESLAIDAGVGIASDWPDPLRDADFGKPDVGAAPSGATPWRIGIHGRLTLAGAMADDSDPPAFEPVPFPAALPDRTLRNVKPAAFVEGYPAFDLPLIEFLLRRDRIPTETFTRQWLDTEQYGRYGMVVLVGDLSRAKIEPNTYGKEDLVRVRKFLEDGGTLLVTRSCLSVFGGSEGRKFLEDHVGRSAALSFERPAILQPTDPWVRHLEKKNRVDWLTAGSPVPLRASQGDRIIGVAQGPCSLYRLRVGKGRLVYLGWSIASSLPGGRSPSTVEEEQAYEEQFTVLRNVLAERRAED